MPAGSPPRAPISGHTTLYSHDARGLEASRTEATGTPEERTVTTTWHLSLRVPISITEPGKAITFTYDAALLTRTETDPATGATRATTHTYNGLGLLETVDGGRAPMSAILRASTTTLGAISSPPPTPWVT